MTNVIYAPISIGELFDKITILEIKLEQYIDKQKLIHVVNELTELNKLAKDITTDLSDELAELKKINKIIWDNEDLARTYSNKLLDDTFMRLADSTYKANTRRAEIKRKINEKCNSKIIETKSYIEEK